MGLEVKRHVDAAAFLTRAERWLLADEAEHNLLLGIAHAVARGRADYQSPLCFVTVEENGEIVGCAYRTPPFKLGLTRMPLDAVPLLVRTIEKVYDELPAVLGPEREAKAFAIAWGDRRGVRHQAGMRQRIYQMDSVVQAARPIPGELVVATPEHTDLVTEWINEFSREAGVNEVRARYIAESRIAEKMLFLWQDGEPVSLAGWSALSPNGMRIGPVYTPPQHRGHGYGSAVTAGASQKAFDSGIRFCFLYTDLSNATSNSIYRRIGYRPVCDVIDWTFEN
jgi:GNAT superfamily N-acetyltransferase